MGYKQVFLNSRSSNNSNLNNPLFILNRSIYVNKYKIQSVEIPLSFYSVNSNNNKLYFVETGSQSTTRTVTFPVGDYTSSSLVSTLETHLNAQGTYTYTVSYSNSTYKVTIGSTDNFKILASSTCSWLGLSASDSSLADSYTFPKILNLSGPSSLYLLASEISSSSNIHNSESINVLEKIPISGNKGEIVFWENPRDFGWVDSNNSLSSLTLKLLDADTLDEIDLNGLPFSVCLAISDADEDQIW